MNIKTRLSAFILLLFSASYIYAQAELKPGIAVFPLENPSQDLQIDIISLTVQRTIELNLKVIDRYVVRETDIKEYSTDPAWLTSYCEENSLDNILFGKVVIGETTGAIFLEMSVFSFAEEAVTITHAEVAETVFDIFDAADSLALRTMEAFSGMRLGFGALEFNNRGDEGKYTVFVDDVLIGDNILNVPRVLNGERNITVIQERMHSSLVLFDRLVFIIEKQTNNIEFSIPGFMEEEAQSIEKPESYILARWDNKYAARRVDRNFETLFELLEIYDYSRTAMLKREEIDNMHMEWERKKEEWGDSGGLAILDRRAGAAVFTGINFMTANYAIEGAPGWKPSVTINPRAGLSLSWNVFNNLAVQGEFVYNHVDAQSKNSNILLTSGLRYHILEFPLMIVYRFPVKVFNAYAGANPILRISEITGYFEQGGETEEFDIPDSSDLYEPFGASVIAGMLVEIPVKMNYIMLDLRYSRTLNNWSNIGDEYFYPDYFALTVGYGFKFF